MTQSAHVTVTVNEKEYKREVEPRLLLSDFLRHEFGLTGTHVGCEHGVCGACTVLFDGESARSCLIFAVQADGHHITTVEGLATSSPHLGGSRGVGSYIQSNKPSGKRMVCSAATARREF